MRLGVNVPQYSIDFEGGCVSMEAAVAFAVEAERAGVDSLWASDHPFVIGPDGVRYEALDPIDLLEAIAAATSHVRVGTLVLATARRGVEGTIAAAERLARVAPGRAIFGLGTGWYEPEFPDGLPSFGDRLAILESTAAAIGGEVLVGGAGGSAMRVAVRHARAWNVAWDIAPDAFARANETLDRLCSEMHRDPRSLERTVGLTIAVGDIDGQVDRVRARAPFLRSLDTTELPVVNGPAASVAQRMAGYRADEVIVAPFVRDDAAGLADLVAALRAETASARR